LTEIDPKIAGSNPARPNFYD